MGDGPGGVEKTRWGGEIILPTGGTATENFGIGGSLCGDFPIGRGSYVTACLGVKHDFLTLILRGESSRAINNIDIERLKAEGTIDPKANTKNNIGGVQKEGNIRRTPGAAYVYPTARIEVKGHIPNSPVAIGGGVHIDVPITEKNEDPTSGSVNFNPVNSRDGCVDLPGENFCRNIPRRTQQPSVAFHRDGTRSTEVAGVINIVAPTVDIDLGDLVTLSVNPLGLQVYINPSGETVAGYYGGVNLRLHTSGRTEEVSPATAKVGPQVVNVDVGGTAKYTFETNRAGKLKYVIKNIEGTAVAEDSEDVHDGSNDVDILAKNGTNPLPPGQYLVNFTFEPEKGKVEWHKDGNIKSLVVKAPAAVVPTLSIEPATVTVTKDDPATINVSSSQVGRVTYQIFDGTTEVGSGAVDITNPSTAVPATIPTTDPRITPGTQPYRVVFTLAGGTAEATLTVSARAVEKPPVDYRISQEGRKVKLVFGRKNNNYGHGKFQITINGISVTKDSKLTGKVNFQQSDSNEAIVVPTAGGKIRPATHAVRLVPDNNTTLRGLTEYNIVVTPADDATRARLDARTLMITMRGGKIVDTDRDGINDQREAKECVGKGQKGKVNTTGAQIGCPKTDDEPPPPPPTDSDGDGVPDDKDKCRGQGRKGRVDTTGCPKI